MDETGDDHLTIGGRFVTADPVAPPNTDASRDSGILFSRSIDSSLDTNANETKTLIVRVCLQVSRNKSHAGPCVKLSLHLE